MIEQILSMVNPDDYYFWATHGGVELDLLIMTGGKRIGFEMKYSDAPSTSKSMRIAIKDLSLDEIIVYPLTHLPDIRQHIG